MGTKKPETAWDTFTTVQRNKARALRLKADAMERKLAARPPGNVVGAAEVIAKVLHFHGSSRAATQLMQMLRKLRATPPALPETSTTMNSTDTIVLMLYIYICILTYPYGTAIQY